MSQTTRESESLSDMRIRFEASDKGVEMMHVDANGNRINLGSLTRIGALRLIGRLGKLFGLNIKIRIREEGQ